MLPIARRVQQTMQEGSAMSHMLPNARMCGRCCYGPVEVQSCDDLLAHHGQRRHDGSRVSNRCPQCNWFATNFSDWPRYVPNAGHEAIWAAAHAEEDEAAVAERRSKREADLQAETSQHLLALADARRRREGRMEERLRDMGFLADVRRQRRERISNFELELEAEMREAAAREVATVATNFSDWPRWIPNAGHEAHWAAAHAEAEEAAARAAAERALAEAMAAPRAAEARAEARYR